MPEIIDDFFGRAWVQEICPTEALKTLENRFSRFDSAALRIRLRDCYSSWMTTIDPGLLIRGQDHRGQIHPAIPITDRFIQPDIFTPTFQSHEPPTEKSLQPPLASASASLRSDISRPDTAAVSSNVDEPVRGTVRTSLNRFLASEERAIISGQAGAGKSALLRFLALDILSDAPLLESVRAKYSQHIPVWIPFALWTRMATENGDPPPVADVVTKFLHAQGCESAQRFRADRRAKSLFDHISAGAPNDADLQIDRRDNHRKGPCSLRRTRRQHLSRRDQSQRRRDGRPRHPAARLPWRVELYLATAPCLIEAVVYAGCLRSRHASSQCRNHLLEFVCLDCFGIEIMAMALYEFGVTLMHRITQR